MDSELFDVWFNNHFLRYAPLARPILLLMDGHSSHYCPDVIRMASKHNVVLFTLPPHTTHMHQPLDRGCFGPLKTKWREVCYKYITDNPGKVVTRYSFSRLFHEAWVKAMTMNNIMSGFKVTGVFPVDRSAIHCTHQPKILSEESKIAFLPLYSPAPSRSKSRSNQPNFSAAELELFQIRYEDNYDLKNDHRYNLWLHQMHPDDSEVQQDKAAVVIDEFEPQLDESFRSQSPTSPAHNLKEVPVNESGEY